MIKERLHSVLITKSEIDMMKPEYKERAIEYNNLLKNCIDYFELHFESNEGVFK